MTDKTIEASIFTRIGGNAAISAFVDVFYGSVLEDTELAAFFEGVNLTWLKETQVNFLTGALGGPDTYTGRSMEVSHERLGITQDHFDLVAGHLVAGLAATRSRRRTHRRGRGRGRTPQRVNRDHGKRPFGTFN